MPGKSVYGMRFNQDDNMPYREEFNELLLRRKFEALFLGNGEGAHETQEVKILETRPEAFARSTHAPECKLSVLVAAVVRRLASGVTIAATTKPTP
jgi:hypothetical protein